MTVWLIAINIAVFVVDLLSVNVLRDWGELSIDAIRHAQVWRLITFQFLHADPWHLIVNMMWLYFFGPMVEGRMGKMRFLAFYLICGLAGGGAFIAMWLVHFPRLDDASSLVGASAGIFGSMVAATYLAPGMRLRLWFPPISVTLRVVMWIAIGLALVTIYTGGWNSGGEAAHLGGAAAGAILIRNVRWLNRFGARQHRQRFWRPGDSADNFFRKDAI